MLSDVDCVDRRIAVSGQSIPKTVQHILARRSAELHEIAACITVGLGLPKTFDAVQRLMYITNHVKQPGQIIRLQRVRTVRAQYRTKCVNLGTGVWYWSAAEFCPVLRKRYIYKMPVLVTKEIYVANVLSIRRFAIGKIAT